MNDSLDPDSNMLFHSNIAPDFFTIHDGFNELLTQFTRDLIQNLRYLFYSATKQIKRSKIN